MEVPEQQTASKLHQIIQFLEQIQSVLDSSDFDLEKMSLEEECMYIHGIQSTINSLLQSSMIMNGLDLSEEHAVFSEFDRVKKYHDKIAKTLNSKKRQTAVDIKSHT